MSIRNAVAEAIATFLFVFAIIAAINNSGDSARSPSVSRSRFLHSPPGI